MSETKGIHLIVLFTPFKPSKNLDILYKNIDKNHKIVVTIPIEYLAIFKKGNFFDEGQLNKKEALLFTEKIR